MTAALLVTTLLAACFQGNKAPPTVLECEQSSSSPVIVTDHRPDFRAVNPFNQNAIRYRLRVSPETDPGFLNPIWISPTGPQGTPFPGNFSVPNGTMSPEIPYGNGTANWQNLTMLEWGKNYRWEICMGRNTNNNNNWTGWSAHQNFIMASPTSTISQHSNNGSATAPSWRFIGVPIAIGTTVPAAELLAEVPLLYRLDEPSRTWVPMTSGDVLEGGRGYLAWCDSSTVLTLSQGSVMHGVPPIKDPNGLTTTPSYVYTNTFSFTTLGAAAGGEITDGQPANAYRGNHLFANPFYARLSWKNSNSGTAPVGHIQRTGISEAMYKWDGTQYLTYNGTTNVGSAGEWIEPFQAVGIWVTSANHQLGIDFPATPLTGGPLKASGPAAPKRSAFGPSIPADPDSWHLMIEARSGAAIDTENAFGIDPLADDAWDQRDTEEPGPGTPSWVTVSFDHRGDWSVNPRKYTHDFRKTSLKAGDEIVWTFTVDGNTGLPATLTWPNLSDIPAMDWKFTLEDPATSTVTDLSTVSSYDTQAVNGPSTMTLRATRLKDSPSLSAGGTGGSGGGNCGLLGLEGLLLGAWMLARRRCKMMS